MVWHGLNGVEAAPRLEFFRRQLQEIHVVSRHGVLVSGVVHDNLSRLELGRKLLEEQIRRTVRNSTA